jgi:putative endonuclease
MADPRHLLGIAAEARVSAWLEGLGWVVLARRHREAGGGEVDLVALDSTGILVAVEVRARRTIRSGSAAMTVDSRRVRRLARTLAAVAARSPPHRGLRIDLVTVEPADAAADRWLLRRIAGIG